jgi:hypothetical protein
MVSWALQQQMDIYNKGTNTNVTCSYSQVSAVTFTFLCNIVCCTGTENKNTQTLLLTQLTSIVCFGVLIIQITKTVCLELRLVCTHQIRTFIAEPIASMPSVLNTSNGRDPELLLFTSMLTVYLLGLEPECVFISRCR